MDFRSLFFWSIIDYLAPSLRDDLKDNPRILAELKKHIRSVEKDLGDAVRWDIPEALKENIPASFQPYISDRELVKILQEFDAEPDQLTQLAALSGIVQSAEEVKAKEQTSVITEQQPIDSEKQKRVASSEDTELSREMKPAENNSLQQFQKLRFINMKMTGSINSSIFLPPSSAVCRE